MTWHAKVDVCRSRNFVKFEAWETYFFLWKANFERRTNRFKQGRYGTHHNSGDVYSTYYLANLLSLWWPILLPYKLVEQKCPSPSSFEHSLRTPPRPLFCSLTHALICQLPPFPSPNPSSPTPIHSPTPHFPTSPSNRNLFSTPYPPTTTSTPTSSFPALLPIESLLQPIPYFASHLTHPTNQLSAPKFPFFNFPSLPIFIPSKLLTPPNALPPNPHSLPPQPASSQHRTTLFISNPIHQASTTPPLTLLPPASLPFMPPTSLPS